MAEKLTSQTQISLTDLSREDLFWIAKMDEAAGSRDRTVDLAAIEQFIGQGSLQVTQTAHGFSVGDVLQFDGTNYVEATADTAANARSAALVVDVPDVDTLVLRSAGYVTGLSGLTAGSWYYLQDAGGLGTSAGTVEKPILLATATDQGWVLPLGFAVEDLGGVSSMDDLSDADTTTQSPTSDDSLRFDGSDWVPLVHNFAATGVPTVNDDSGSNYELGSLWVDGTNDKAYICLDASAGAAVWVEITQSGGGTTNFTDLGDTPANYTGDGGKLLAVNSAEDAVEFVDEPLQSFVVAASDETTDLSTGTAKVTFRMPYAFTVSEVRASVTTAPTGSALQVDINESGSSILSTEITIDDGEKTSETAATAPVISDSALADDAEITIDIDSVGSTTPGAGLKVTIIGRPA